MLTPADKLLLHQYRNAPKSVGGFLPWSSQMNFTVEVEKQLSFIDRMFLEGLSKPVLQSWMNLLEEALDIREPRSPVLSEHFIQYQDLDGRYEDLYAKLLRLV